MNTKLKVLPKHRSVSNHYRIKKVLAEVIGRKHAMTLKELKKALEGRLGVKLREDYLVCNLLGQDFLIDCKTKIVVRN